MDRMRESLFAVLGNLSGMSFLDLYCGSGIIGIEAASRGADPVYLVEKDRGKVQVIRQNIAFVEERISVVMIPVERFIRIQKITFDVIFLDPPFKQRAKEQVIESISSHGLLSPDGRLIVHFPRLDRLGTEIGRFRSIDTRTYGNSIVQIYGYA